MDKISEADNEDEKNNNQQSNLLAKINSDLKNKDEYQLDEHNIDELMGESNIKSNNVKEYFDPCLYNNTDLSKSKSNRKLKQTLNKSNNNLLNKSDDTSNPRPTDPIEVKINIYI
jgi:hypothetical protein